MNPVILVFADCVNPKAKGDYQYAVTIARDLILALKKTERQLDVIVTSRAKRIHRYKKLYPLHGSDEIISEGQIIPFCSLESFDSIHNRVIAFIDANRCRYAPEALLRRILAPQSKILFIGAPLKGKMPPKANFFQSYRERLNNEQPGIYDYFHDDDLIPGISGIGEGTLGLPNIRKTIDIERSDNDVHPIPDKKYAVIYLSSDQATFDLYESIYQYIQLTKVDSYVLIGQLAEPESRQDLIQYLNKPITTIAYPSLKNETMRHLVNQSHSSLVATTGIFSALECLQDGKLPYYQYLEPNKNFVRDWTCAFHSIVQSEANHLDGLGKMLIETSCLLFKKKPLNNEEFSNLNAMLSLDLIIQHLGKLNQMIIAKESGRLAPQLLAFIQQPSRTKLKEQYLLACKNLKEPGQEREPENDEALRQAASRGRILELKILLEQLDPAFVNKASIKEQRTALHLAAIAGQVDCVKILLNYGAQLDLMDAMNMTALDYILTSTDLDLNKRLQLIRLCDLPSSAIAPMN